MLNVPLPIVTFVRPVHWVKALYAMTEMLPGIVRLVIFVELKNALVLISVTGKPLVAAGMTTSPPGPVYPGMVMAPLLVTYVNCAWRTTGKTSRSSSDTGAGGKTRALNGWRVLSKGVWASL